MSHDPLGMTVVVSLMSASGVCDMIIVIDDITSPDVGGSVRALGSITEGVTWPTDSDAFPSRDMDGIV